MTFWLLKLWHKVRLWLALAGAFIGALAFAYAVGRRDGKNMYRVKAETRRAEYNRRMAELQKRYQLTPEPTDDDLDKTLRNGGFVFALLIVLPLASCAHTPQPEYEASMICPVPTPVSKDVQRKAADELRACGKECQAIRRLLKACARDRRNMRKCDMWKAR